MESRKWAKILKLQSSIDIRIAANGLKSEDVNPDKVQHLQLAAFALVDFRLEKIHF